MQTEDEHNEAIRRGLLEVEVYYARPIPSIIKSAVYAAIFGLYLSILVHVTDHYLIWVTAAGTFALAATYFTHVGTLVTIFNREQLLGLIKVLKEKGHLKEALDISKEISDD